MVWGTWGVSETAARPQVGASSAAEAGAAAAGAQQLDVEQQQQQQQLLLRRVKEAQSAQELLEAVQQLGLDSGQAAQQQAALVSPAVSLALFRWAGCQFRFACSDFLQCT